jgi:NTE family protein
LADVIVGTSAGAIVGSAVASGRLGLLRDDIDFFGLVPKLLADLIPTDALSRSQVRARDLAKAARDGSTGTIQSVGRAAMAARNSPVRNLQLMIDILNLGHSWPSSRFHATTIDCYTGERLVLSQSSNIPISHAVCASASLPGVFGPTWIGDRLCMDGAMCSTNTHLDLVADAERALVVVLTDKDRPFSSIPNIEQELNYVETAGTKTLLIAADPGKVFLLLLPRLNRRCKQATIGPCVRPFGSKRFGLEFRREFSKPVEVVALGHIAHHRGSHEGWKQVYLEDMWSSSQTGKRALANWIHTA